MKIVKRTLIILFVIFISYQVIVEDSRDRVAYMQSEFVSRYLGAYFEIYLPEPEAYILRYSQLNEANNDIYIFHLDTSNWNNTLNWNSDDILSKFTKDLILQEETDIINYCAELGYNTYEQGIVKNIASSFNIDDCVFKEIKKDRIDTSMAILYNYSQNESLLLVSIHQR